jgi:hypothetical protein
LRQLDLCMIIGSAVGICNGRAAFAGLRRPTPTEALLAAAGGRSRLLKTTSGTETVAEEDCYGATGLSGEPLSTAGPSPNA